MKTSIIVCIYIFNFNAMTRSPTAQLESYSKFTTFLAMANDCLIEENLKSNLSKSTLPARYNGMFRN